MNNGRVVAIDCDEVLVNNAGKLWWDWLVEMAGDKQDFEFGHIKDNYDYGQHFEPFMPHGVCPYDYFRMNDLYCGENVKPIEGSVEAFERIRDAGHQIVIVSFVMGDHFRSKLEFLNRNFGITEMDFIAAKNKGLIRADMIIDDRHKNLMQFNAAETQRVLFETSFERNRDNVDWVQPDWSQQSVDKLLNLLD